MQDKADLDLALEKLMALDERLVEVWRVAGDIPYRGREGGLTGLVRIVVGQQLSIESAAAIWSRLQGLWPCGTLEGVSKISWEALRAAGLSSGKIRTIHAICEAIEGGLDLDRFQTLDGDKTKAELTRIKGIGPWTADVYRMFCTGNPDVFAAGDLALRKAVSMAWGANETLSEADVAAEANHWSPYRTAAAWLFWGYFRARKSKDGIGL